jgi:AsmA protein
LRKLLIGLAVTVVAILAVVAAATMLVPAVFLKARIVEYVRAKTGRELQIAGPVSLSFFPQITLVASDVTLSNMAGGSAPNMLQLKAIEASGPLLPLFRGAIEADRIVVTQPQLNLEIDEDGRRNWVFRAPQSSATEPGPTASREDWFSVRAGRIEIDGGAVSYLDRRDGKIQAAAAIDMTVTLPHGAGPVDARGSADWDGETVRFVATAASLEALRHGASTPAIISVDSAPLSFDFRGDISRGRPVSAAGTISAKAPSLRRLLAWAGVPVGTRHSGFGPLSLKGKIDIGAAKYAVAGATIALDGSTATGDLTLERGGARPSLSGSLAVDRLNFDPYLKSPPETPVPAAPAAVAPSSKTGSPVPPAPASAPPPQPAPGPILSEVPLNLAPLKSLDADLRISASSIHLSGFDSGKSVLALRLKDGRMSLDVVEMALYGGKGFGIVVIDGPAFAVAANLRLAGVEVQPLFAVIAHIDQLSGKGDLAFDLRSRGGNARELVAALDGNGRINLADGRISGVDAAQLMTTANVPDDVPKPTARALAYKTLSATYTVSRGILRNDDLKLNSPELTSTGAGTVDLPHCRVDYLWLPDLIDKGSAQIAITGPCDDPTYRAMSLTINRGMFPKRRR